MLNIGLLN